ncbi:EAL domain-containing protein [Dactylosporangium siamense]|uniref:EAL domain-containing protein n=1 Tax=Dactylosporangium siamense TaxID=685454 RepID=A0A919PJS6_9ACTN|nr:EAL domain-containing protein [Dactylosporangium siamense]GIG45442.1 hypothetical protein Dsi01nite_034830 [Dactylosporangium siamense]
MTRTVDVRAREAHGTGAMIGAVLDGRLVRPVFQPIVDLSTRAVVGMEALARGPAGSVLEFPDRLFAAARDAGRFGELDMLCAERALELAVAAPVPPPLLFVNAEPAVLDQPLSPRLIELVSAGLPFREVLEFTERALPSVPGSMLRLVGAVQQWGNAIALDDVGVDPMSLAFLPVLEPEVIKLDMSLVRNPEAHTTRAVAAVVRSEARRTGAVVIAEGVETEDDLVVARDLGAHWGQGWLFGRPGRIEQASDRFDATAREALRPPRPGFHQAPGTPFQAAGRATVGSAETVAEALTGLRRVLAADRSAVVLVSSGAGAVPGIAGSLDGLVGQARSVIVIDKPVTDEFTAVVIGAGYGHALCVRSSGPLEVAVVEDLPTVAAVTRALLNRHG